jgi:hypothetical protein
MFNANPATATPAGSAPPPPLNDPYGSPYQTQQQPYITPSQQTVVDPSVSPGLAFILGFIPGVGAIYNGQYAKGLIHVVILGVLITLIESSELRGFEPLFGLSMAAFVFYQCFEAYHTAKRRMMGQKVDEFSSLINMDDNRLPVGPIVLIVAGVFFLLANFDLIRVRDVIRFWPLGLIGIGCYMLYVRMNASRSKSE